MKKGFKPGACCETCVEGRLSNYTYAETLFRLSLVILSTNLDNKEFYVAAIEELEI